MFVHTSLGRDHPRRTCKKHVAVTKRSPEYLVLLNNEMWIWHQARETLHLSLLFFECMFVSFLPQSILLLLLLPSVCYCLGLCLAGSGCGRLRVLSQELLWHLNSCSSAESQKDRQETSESWLTRDFSKSILFNTDKASFERNFCFLSKKIKYIQWLKTLVYLQFVKSGNYFSLWCLLLCWKSYN